MLHRLRMLMNAEGSSPGGGAPGGGGPPANPQAQGGAGLDVDALASKLAGVLGPQIRDSVFAEARKSGMFKTKKDDDPATPQTPTPSGGGDQPLTQASVAKMLERRDGLAVALDGTKLSAGARSRLVRDFERDAPEDIGRWVGEYLADFGLRPQGGAQVPDQPRPPGQPVSGTGAPPSSPSLGVSEDTPIWKLPQADIEHLVKTKGAAYVRERYYRNLRATRVRVRNY